MRKFSRLAFLLLAAVTVMTAQARDAAPMAEDPVVEARMLAMSEELRCLVCQNETLAASRAELAEDLRVEIRKLIKQGKTDKEVMDFLVDRYGDFVRYRPPVKPTTWLLWFGPFVFLLAGITTLVFYLRRRGGRVIETPLSAQDQAKAEALLTDKEFKA